jgi:uncharacterized protein (TIGR02099 family)
MPARILNTLWLWFVFMLLMSALALTAARLWVPTLGEYRSDLEELVGELLDRPVSISRMDVTWRGLGPVIKLRDVVISNPEQPRQRLAVAEIWLGLDVWKYARERILQLKGIDIIGADLTVIRDENGKIYIDRLKGKGDAGQSLAGLLEIQRLAIHDSVIIFHDRLNRREPARFSDVTFRLESTGDRHALIGYAMLPDQLGYRVDVQGLFRGAVGDIGKWSGRLYMKGQALALTNENLAPIISDVDVQGVADVRCWIDVELADLQSIRGEIDISDLRVQRTAAAVPLDYTVNRFGGVFGWRDSKPGWQFTVQRLSVEHDAETRERSLYSLAGRTVDGERYIAGEFAYLYLQDVQSFLRMIPGLEDKHWRQIANFTAEGTVSNLSVSFRSAGDVIRVLGFDASFDDLGFRDTTSGAAIHGLQGTITGVSDAGALWLQSRDVGFRAEKLFRDTLQFDDLAGEVAWRYDYDNERLIISGKSLNLSNDNLELTASLGLDLPKAGSSPVVDMEIDIQRGDLAAVRQYLPATIMSPKAVAWLDRSLVSGEITGGRFILQGPLDRAPFDNGEGQLTASLPVSNAILDYNEAWTRIEQLDAEIAFNGRSMDIHGKKGKIRSASLGEVHARIKDLTAPDLEIDGSVYGSLPVMLAELASSPLGNTYGGFVDRISSSGDAALHLDIDISLRGKRPVDVRGEILLKGNTLVVKEAEVSLDNIKGKLAFDTRGIKGRSLEANLFEKPVIVDVWTDGTPAVTNISLHGPLALVDLARKNNMQLAPFLSGRSEWEVLLGIGRLQRRSDKPGVALKISSTLEGVGIELPEPFGKPPAEVRPFAISVEDMNDPERVMRFRYADIANGVFEMKQAAQGLEWDKGNIAIGAEPAVLPDEDVLSITGRLQRLALSRWQRVFARWQSGTGPPLKTDVRIDELLFAGHRLPGVEVQAVKTGLVQDITLGGAGVEGKLQLDYEGGGIEQIVMNLDHLVVEKDAGNSAGNDLSLSPAAFPNLRVTVQEFTYAGIDLGEVDLLAIREAGKIHVDRLVLASDFLDLRMMGDWEQVDGESISRFNITYSDGLLEALLEAFDYKENVSGGSLSGSLRASWPGDPWDFLPERANGKLYLLIKDGQLLDVEPGAGRVLGLLSLHTLSRRLLLDFSDLFKKGFTFDRIEGNFTLTGGDAQTSDLTIEGPAARIEIAGRVGLAAKDYDELVTVIPRVGSSLPLAGAIAGGPVVGAALLVADKLLSKEIEGMTSFAHTSYSVTGPWSDPVYTKLASPAIETVTTEPEDIE